MIQPLQEFSTAAITAAMETNLREFAVACGRSPGADLLDEPGLLGYDTGIPHPALNGVVHVQLSPEEADRQIPAVLSRFGARDLPMMWMLGPSTQPPDLGDRLVALGLIREDRPGIGAEDLGMAVDLLAMTTDLPRPAGLVIRPVDDETSCWQWCDAARQGLELTREVADGCFRLLSGLPSEGSWRHYVGYLAGEPVATCTLLPGSRVAGIYIVSTVPAARRQGIATAVVLKALADAAEMGYRIGILMAAPMGAGVYRRIGFREYCAFHVYFRPG